MPDVARRSLLQKIDIAENAVRTQLENVSYTQPPSLSPETGYVDETLLVEFYETNKSTQIPQRKFALEIYQTLSEVEQTLDQHPLLEKTHIEDRLTQTYIHLQSYIKLVTNTPSTSSEKESPFKRKSHIYNMQ